MVYGFSLGYQYMILSQVVKRKCWKRASEWVPYFPLARPGGPPKNFFEKYSYITVYEPEAKGGCLQFAQLG